MSLVIRVRVIVGEAFCAVAADAVNGTRIRNKTRAAKAKYIEENFSLFLTYSPSSC